MSATERKLLDETLTALTAGHTPELDGNVKLVNGDKNTADLVLITEESSDAAFKFMTELFGENPFITE